MKIKYDPKVDAAYISFKNRGVEVRLVEGTKRMAVIDEHSFVFLTDVQQPKNDRVAWIKSSYVADSLKKAI